MPTGNPPGRKRVLDGARKVMINLEADQIAWLADQAASTGLSMSEVVRIQIARGMRIQREFPALGLKKGTTR